MVKKGWNNTCLVLKVTCSKIAYNVGIGLTLSPLFNCKWKNGYVAVKKLLCVLEKNTAHDRLQDVQIIPRTNSQIDIEHRNRACSACDVSILRFFYLLLGSFLHQPCATPRCSKNCESVALVSVFLKNYTKEAFLSLKIKFTLIWALKGPNNKQKHHS